MAQSRSPSAGFPARVVRASRALHPDQRLAAAGALGLLLSMFLPWYATTGLIKVGSRFATAHDTQTAIQAFTFVEAAILLVALAVLVLLFVRAEGRAFHLPGGDGWVVSAAGAWVVLLVFWRLFDKPSLGTGVTVKLHWGIFLALIPAAVLLWAGSRMRAAHRPEPPLPGEDDWETPPPRPRRAVAERAERAPAQRAPRPRVPLPAEVPELSDPPPPVFTERRRRPEPEPPPEREPQPPSAPAEQRDPDRLF
jgi:hypothetical protein